VKGVEAGRGKKRNGGVLKKKGSGFTCCLYRKRRSDEKQGKAAHLLQEVGRGRRGGGLEKSMHGTPPGETKEKEETR